MMEPQASKFSEFRSVYATHTADIPRLRTIVHQIDNVLSTIIQDVKKLPFFLKANVDFNLYALADLNKALVKMLEDNHSCAAEALSRVASEQAVNLIFVIEGDSDERAKSLISNYVNMAIKKAKDWLILSKDNKQDSSVKSAQQKLDYMECWKAKFDTRRAFKGIKPWPSAYDRFTKVGFEELYRTIFLASSDSIHGFPDDIFNSTILGYYSDEILDDAFKGYVIEKRSFAVFLATYAIALYVQAIHSLALKLDKQNLAEELRSLADVVNSIIATHENDHKKMESKLGGNGVQAA